MPNPYQVVKDFEQALCEYTGAKYAVTTTSCTMALFLSLQWCCDYWGTDFSSVKIPKRTYVSVPMVIKQCGLDIDFRDTEWKGSYQLRPLPIWDSARRFTSGMYSREGGDPPLTYLYSCTGQFVCVSFHWSKILGIGQGGAILHDNDEADEWFRKARFDGRTEGVAPKDDKFDMMGWHAYMSPRDAAEGLSRLAVLPEHNAALPNDPYPDLSTFEIFK